MDSFIEEAKQIEFQQPYGNLFIAAINPPEYGNGINYIHLFIRVPVMYYKCDKNLEEKKQKLDNFRHCILFPLSRYYHRLYSFLVRIKNDKVLGLDYQNMLYNYIERDLLQNYFRIFNNKTSGNIDYDLSIFDTELYKSKSFYLINNFYIENNAFQHEDLNFYTHTQ